MSSVPAYAMLCIVGSCRPQLRDEVHVVDEDGPSTREV